MDSKFSILVFVSIEIIKNFNEFKNSQIGAIIKSTRHLFSQIRGENRFPGYIAYL